MNRGKLPSIPPDIASLLDCEREFSAEPEDVRRRAMLRARAALSGISVTPGDAPVRHVARRRPGFAWMFAAAAVVAATFSAAAIRNHRSSNVVPPQALSPAQVAAEAPSAPASPPVALPAEETPASAPAPTSRPAPLPPPSGPERYALELKVLKPARAALARHDYGSTLAAIAEHERRFPNGQLAEEREALRINALSGEGRADDAHRAAAAFRTRFPQSVLLSRMKEPKPAAP